MKTLLFILGVLTAQLHAQGTAAAELAAGLAKKLGATAGAEFAGAGGEKALAAMLARAAAEGGEPAAKSAAAYCEQFGPAAMQALEAAPAQMVRSLDKIPASFADAAIRAAAREPALLAKLVAQAGDDALLVAAKHPGVGTDIAAKLGRSGVAAAKELATPDAIRLARAADEIAAVAPAERVAVLEKIGRYGGRALDFLERHPRLLATAAGVGVFLAAKDEILGSTEAPGFVERVLDTTLHTFKTPLGIILVAAAALVFARAWMILVRVRKMKRRGR